MNKVIVLLAILLSINTSVVFAQNATLDKIEDSIYGFQYSNQDDRTRLDRIEETVYGKKNSGSDTQRIAKLKTDMSADLIGHEIEPKEDTFRDDEPEIITRGANINYPAINELEQEVFKQEYKDKDIKERLASLEQKTFGKTYSDDFSTRVDRLKAEIKPQSIINNAIAQSANDFYGDETDRLDDNYSLSEYNPPSQFSYEDYNARNSLPSSGRKVSLSAMENSILRKTFPNDSTDNRLSRMETQMFGTMFNDDNQETRINRLSSAYKAQKSAPRYDSNKFSQNMATAVQIGTLILMVLACIL